MLKRKVPLKQKKPMRRGGFLRHVSKKMASKLSVYRVARQKYLLEHPLCEISMELFGSDDQAVEIHHRKGRVATLLTDCRFFMAVCRRSHQWIHSNPREAMERGYILK